MSTDATAALRDRGTGESCGTSGGSGGRRVRRRAAVAAAAAVLAVAVGVVVSWLAEADDRLERVRVRVDEPVCVGTDVVTRRPPDSVTPVPTIRMRRGMDCILPIEVANVGDHEVRLDRLVLRHLGPGSGLAARVARVGEMRPLGPGARRSGRQHAIFVVEAQLLPGSHHVFEVPISFRPAGCSSPGNAMFVSGAARVEVSTLGRTRQIAPAALGFVGTDDSSCAT